MAKREPRYSPEESGRRGQEIYDRIIRPTLKREDHNKFVAIDIESEAYEMDPSEIVASDRLFSRYPDAQIWLMQVGQLAARRMGVRALSGDRP